MKLVNMEMSQEERDEYSKGSIAAEQPKYSWGLKLNLDDDALEKLGIKELPKVGTKMRIEAVAEVDSASAYDSKGSDRELSLSLQITDMAVEEHEEEESPSDSLYGKK